MKESLVVDQLTACVEEALSLEEEVLAHLNDPLMHHSGLSGGVPEVGSEPLPIGSSGHRITPADVPPSSAANSNIPSSEVHPVTLVGNKVIWTSSSRPARRRSLEAVSRVSPEVSDLSKSQSTRSNDPLFLGPIPTHLRFPLLLFTCLWYH